MRINYNPIAQSILNNLDKIDLQSAASLRRLSTGERVQAAKDDAAGLSVSNLLKADVSAKAVVIRGLSDGANYCHIAEGALDSILDLVRRGNELAMKAASDNISDNERSMLNEDFKFVKDQIDQIAYGTEAFGKHPLLDSNQTKLLSKVLPNGGTSVHMKSGIESIAIIPANTQNLSVHINDNGLDDTIQLFTKSGKHLAGSVLSDGVWTANLVDASNVDSVVLTQANGFASGASYDATNLNDAGAGYNATPPYDTSTYNGMTIGYSGSNNPTNLDEYLHIDTVTEDLVLQVVGSGAFNADATWDSMPGQAEGGDEDQVKILAESRYRGEDSFIKIPKTPADTQSLGVKNAEIDPSEMAREALDELNQAMDQISQYQSIYGAKLNILQDRTDALQNETVSLSSAISAIKDADMATETVELTKDQILTQVGMLTISQANLQPQSVISLLRQPNPHSPQQS